MTVATLRIASDSTRKPIPRKVRLNQTVVDNATCPAGKSMIGVYDSEQPRLVLLVTANGHKTFYAYRKENGTPRRFKLGAASDMTVDQARKACNVALAHPGGLTELLRDRDERKATGSVADLFAAWQRHKGSRKRTAARDAANFTRFCGGIANRAASTIDSRTIATLHAAIGDKSAAVVTDAKEHPKNRQAGGPYAANRVLAMLSAVFRWAARTGRIPANPVVGIDRFPEESRERFLQPDELPKFVSALEAEPDATIRDFFWLLMLTGARRGNVQAMRWENVDLQNKQWRVPAAVAKGKRAVVIPLGEKALQILESRAAEKLDEEFVFPSHGATGHLVEPKSAWKRILKSAGLSNLRIHDVRRTLGSYMAMSGASDRIIGAALGQSTAQATAVYARLRDEPIRAGVAAGTAAIMQHLEPKPAKRKGGNAKKPK